MRGTRLVPVALVVGVLAWTLPVAAQVPGAPVGVSLGLKAGITIATLHGDDAEDPDNRNGFVVGGQIALRSPLFDVQVEGLYVQKGAEMTAGTITHKAKYDYFEVPVLLRKSLPGVVVKPYFLVGPAVAFNTSAKLETEGGIVTKTSTETDVKDQVKDTDIGLVFGVGIRNTRNGVFVEGRYTLGMSDIPESGGDVKNAALAFMAGYSF